MKFTMVLYSEIAPEQWDRMVGSLSEATYQHTSQWLQFTALMSGVVDNHSIAILSDRKEVLAVAPFGASRDTFGNDVGLFGSTPFAAPAIASGTRSLRRKVLSHVLQCYANYSAERNLVLFHFSSSPLSIGYCSKRPDFFPDDFKLIASGYLLHVEHMIMIDLSKSQEELLSVLSTFQRTHIRRSGRDGFTLAVINPSTGDAIEKHR